MSKLFYFLIVFAIASFLLISKPTLAEDTKERTALLRFYGEAYATGPLGSDHQAKGEIHFLKNKRGDLVISDSKEFKLEFKAKVGEDLPIRDCEECKVWFELYKEADGQWTKIFETTFSGKSKIETKSELFDTATTGYTQLEPVAKYKIKIKARAKLSIAGEKSWGWKETVFFIGIAPENQTHFNTADLLEWIKIAKGRNEVYKSLTKIADGVASIDFDKSQCLYSLSLSRAWSHIAAIGTAGISFVGSFTDYFDVALDIPSVIEKDVSISYSVIESLISSSDLKSIISDITDPTSDLKTIWNELGQIEGVVAEANEFCTAFDWHKSHISQIKEKLGEVQKAIENEAQTLEDFYKNQKKIEDVENILNQEKSKIADLKNALTDEVGSRFSEKKVCNKTVTTNCYIYPRTAKLVRSLYRPYNYIFEDENFVDNYLKNKIPEAKINRYNEEQAKAAQAAAETLSRPNLQVSLSFPEEIKRDDAVSINLFLSNTGKTQIDADPTKVAVRLYVDGQLLQEIKFFSFGTIPTGQPLKTTVNWKPANAKIYSFSAIVDPDNIINELYETDNDFTKEVNVVERDLPDLVAEDVVFQTPQAVIHPNEEIKIKAKIKNQGKKKAEGVQFGLYLNGHFTENSSSWQELLAEKVVDTDVGEVSELEAKWKPTYTGNYTITLAINSLGGTKAGRIEEENKTNNILEKKTIVENSKYGLGIDCFNCQMLAVPGKKTNFNFFVINTGNIKSRVLLNPPNLLNPSDFTLEAGESKGIEFSYDFPESAEPGNVSFKVIAQTAGGEAVASKEFQIQIQNPYKIEILPLCQGKICQDEVREIEPGKITSLDFRIKNLGDEFDLGFWIEGNYNGKTCYGNGCYGVEMPQSFRLKRGESRDITLKVKGKEAGNYSLTLKFNVASTWLLSTYSVQLKVKPVYDFNWQVIEQKQIDPQMRWQTFQKIEIENKGNTEMDLESTVISAPPGWEVNAYPQETKIGYEKRANISVDLFLAQAGIGDLIEAGKYPIVLKFKGGTKERNLTIYPEVKAIHKISLNAWPKKAIPQAKTPLIFAVFNSGNIKEDVKVKLVSEIPTDPHFFDLEVEPYSFSKKRDGFSSFVVQLDGSNLSIGKEYLLYLTASNLDSTTKAEAVTKIFVEPKFKITCENRDFCSHSVSAPGKTIYSIQLLNGLGEDLDISLTTNATETDFWQHKLSQTQLKIPKGELKTIDLEVEAKKGAKEDYKIILKAQSKVLEEEFVIVTKVGPPFYIPLYPGLNVLVLFPEEAKCGNGIREADEACDDGPNNGKYGFCKADCSALGERCGDGICQSNENSGNCSADCPKIEVKCTDSDGGINVYTKGTVVVNGASYTDYCQSNTIVFEYRCSDKNVASSKEPCPTNYLCQNGRCIKKLPECSDGIDNDNDGLVDFPADPGCESSSDPDETNPSLECPLPYTHCLKSEEAAQRNCQMSPGPQCDMVEGIPKFCFICP